LTVSSNSKPSPQTPSQHGTSDLIETYGRYSATSAGWFVIDENVPSARRHADHITDAEKTCLQTAGGSVDGLLVG